MLASEDFDNNWLNEIFLNVLVSEVTKY